MNELNLFSGAGGGVLGTQHILGWNTIGYVEWDSFCCNVLNQRMKNGMLSKSPIFCCDIREWNKTIYPRGYNGLVDIITAGFPCQPFSNAGKRLGENDERNMWPSTRDCISLVRPEFALLENVPGILSSGYFGTILGDLAEIGYDCKWRILSAEEMGAPHKRDRVWVLAHSNSIKRRTSFVEQNEESNRRNDFGRNGSIPGRGEKILNSHTSKKRLEGWRLSSREKQKYNNACNNRWWEVEPKLGRVDNGVADRVDRLKAIGNGQVPSVVAAVWELLEEEYYE